MTIENKFSCTENTESGGVHMWINTEYDQVTFHVLGQWENGRRTENVILLSDEQLIEFKKQVAKL